VGAGGPFHDGRTSAFGRTRISPLGFIFHRSSELERPEEAGVLRGCANHEHFVAAGALEEALPTLLATTLRQHGTSAQTVQEWGSADYFVTGQLVRSTLRRDSVPIAALVFGLFGVPYRSAHYDLEYEVSVYDARAPKTPIFARRYEYRGKRLGGFYYNHDAAYALFREGMEATLRSAASDISQAISRAG
jgi:hypothetical protein